MTTTSPVAPSQQRPSDGSPHAIQDRLTGFRNELYGGRGPGISEAEWLANTSLRPTVGEVPTAVSREQLHLRTMRARGQPQAAALEATWSAAQFRAGVDGSGRLAPLGEAVRPLGEAVRPVGGGNTTAAPAMGRLLGGAGLLAAAVVWLRNRRRRRHEIEEFQ